MMRLLGAAASVGILVSGTQAFAAVLTIDQFSNEQWVQDAPFGGNPNASQEASPTAIGGFRDLAVENTKANGSNVATTELHVTGGNLKFSNVAGARGEGTVTYDGNDDPTSVNTTGLGGQNLLIGSNPYFYFAEPDDVKFDNFAFFRVNVWDMNGNTASYEENLTPAFDPRLFFSAFDTDAGFDFGNVGALQFFISSTNTADSVDGAITAIEVRAGDVNEVPLPATGLLLIGAVGGLGLLRRRKNA